MTRGRLLKYVGVVICLLFLVSAGEAQIPKKMNYQGYLTDAGGNPVSGSYQMVFSIYDVSSGGTPIWQETRQVTVANGRYSKNLGDGVPIDLYEAKPYYLGIKVGDDPEMTPRELITTSMYAFFAKHLEGVTIKSGMFGINTTDPKRELHIQAAEGHNDVYFGLTNGIGDYCEIGYDGDSKGLEFRTQNFQTRMFLGDNDLVGIGTKSPQRNLHLQAKTGDNDVYMRFANGNEKYADIGYDGDSHGMELRMQGVAKMFIGDDGKIGLGTTAPVQPFHLKTGMNDAYMRFANVNEKYADIGYDGDSQGMEFRMQGVAKMFISDTGYVGVGMTSPTHPLTVNGAIRAKEILVDNNNWPDFVFHDSYRLMPLNEVEEYIQTEKHLPGIPSAQDMTENGVSIGDMQAKMLQKIEELTLHLIELEKENAQLQERVSSLEMQLQENH